MEDEEFEAVVPSVMENGADLADRDDMGQPALPSAVAN